VLSNLEICDVEEDGYRVSMCEVCLRLRRYACGAVHVRRHVRVQWAVRLRQRVWLQHGEVAA
jgi:hypothetical protein